MIDPAVRLLGIVGPTASGKSALAMELAQQFRGEIVCADSRTVYKGMDIGTAKPTGADRAVVPHWMLDVVEPDQTLSAAEFKRMAEPVVADIARRGKVPLVVGGSGLYVYGLLYDFQFPAGERTEERAKMERTPLAEMVERLWREDPDRAAEIDLQNRRRVVRALETVGLPRDRRMLLGPRMRLIGLRPPEEVLNNNIIRRIDAMLQIGLADEVARLVETYGSEIEVLRSPGYAEMAQFLAGQLTAEKARELMILHTRQLAKRQLTWFKRNHEIEWFETREQAAAAAQQFLQT